MRILGIDPGLGIVGYGVIDVSREGTKAVDYGAIITPKEERLPERLLIIEKCMEEIIATYKPDEIAIEELFFFRNYTTIIPVAMARGVIVSTCYKHNKKIYEYTPLQIKQGLTGVGRAEKKQVQYMVKNVLGLDKVPTPDDVADALAVAICHSQINPELNNNLM